jgi:hypothetical protein
MKLELISDINKLPSVLDVKEVSLRLIELIAVIRKCDISALEGAEAVNDLISYQGYSEEEINLDATKVVMEWISETYDGKNNELVGWQAANVVNLSRVEAIKFLEGRLTKNNSDFERKEINECLAELGVKT